MQKEIELETEIPEVVDMRVPEINAQIRNMELIDNPIDKELTEEEIKDGDISKTAKFQQIWHQSHTPWMRINKKVGRNDPCPCGSGKKYKNCCLLRDEGREIYRLKDDPTYK